MRLLLCALAPILLICKNLMCHIAIRERKKAFYTSFLLNLIIFILFYYLFIYIYMIFILKPTLLENAIHLGL